MAAVTICSDFGAPQNSLSLFPLFPPSICHEVMGLNAMIFTFWMLNFKPAFSLSSFPFIQRLFSSSSLSAIKGSAISISEKSKSEVAQSCLTLCNPMDCSLQGSSIHGIFQARVLESVAISFSRGSSWLRDQTRVSCIVGRCFTIWATREVIYLRLLIFLLAILIPACASSSLASYSAYKLNKQGDNIQPWCTPFLIWNQSIVPCLVASWPADFSGGKEDGLVFPSL